MARDEASEVVCSPETWIAPRGVSGSRATSLVHIELKPRKESRHHEKLPTPRVTLCRAGSTRASSAGPAPRQSPHAKNQLSPTAHPGRGPTHCCCEHTLRPFHRPGRPQRFHRRQPRCLRFHRSLPCPIRRTKRCGICCAAAAAAVASELSGFVCAIARRV